MLKGTTGFEWDDANVDHIACHDVTPEEVEAAVAGKHVIVRAQTVKGEKRKKLYGVAGERFLVVVYTIRDSKFRTVTAYPMSNEEIRLYGTQIIK